MIARIQYASVLLREGASGLFKICRSERSEESGFAQYPVLSTRYSLTTDNWQLTTGFHGN
jgi:hypothetical protein